MPEYDDLTHVGTSWIRVLDRVAEVEHERLSLTQERDAAPGVASVHLQAASLWETFSRWKVLRDDAVSVGDVADELAALLLSTLFVMETLGVDPTTAVADRLNRLEG